MSILFRKGIYFIYQKFYQCDRVPLSLVRVKAEKRKIGSQTTIKEIKVVGNNAEKTRKAPCKALLIVKLKVLAEDRVFPHIV